MITGGCIEMGKEAICDFLECRLEVLTSSVARLETLIFSWPAEISKVEL
jgi:hypothetical protein